jgi:hypothetical protein
LKDHLDVRQYLQMTAVNALLGNIDGLLEAVQNYCFYNSDRPRLYFPWDLDLTLLPERWSAPCTAPMQTESSSTRLPACGSLFDEELCALRRRPCPMRTSTFCSTRSPQPSGPAVKADPYHHLDGGFDAELERIRTWLKARTAFLRASLPPAAPSSLVINEVLAVNHDTNRDGADETDDWVEILNRSAEPAPLAGLFLSDDPAEPLRFALPDVVLPPGERLLIWCDNDLEQGPDHASFQLDGDGEAIGLYEEVDGIVRVHDFLRFGPQSATSPSADPRMAIRASCRCRVRLPAARIQGAAARRSSSAATATAAGPSTSPTRSTSSERFSWVDPALECPASADADGSAAVNVTDPIYLLTHLFASGPPPQEPYPDCGLGTSPGDATLGCAAPPAVCE